MAGKRLDPGPVLDAGALFDGRLAGLKRHIGTRPLEFLVRSFLELLPGESADAVPPPGPGPPAGSSCCLAAATGTFGDDFRRGALSGTCLGFLEPGPTWLAPLFTSASTYAI